MLDRAIANEALRDFTVTVQSNGVHCNKEQARERVAIYRFTILFLSPTIDGPQKRQASASDMVIRVQQALQAWALTAPVIQLNNENFVMVDGTCNTNIGSLSDPLCFLSEEPVGLGMTLPPPEPVISPGGAVAIVLAAILVGVGVACLVLALLLYRSKRDSRRYVGRMYA